MDDPTIKEKLEIMHLDLCDATGEHNMTDLDKVISVLWELKLLVEKFDGHTHTIT